MQTTVIVARLKSAATNAVFQKIRDWTVAGLVRESFWLNLDEPEDIIRLQAKEVDKVDASAWATTVSNTFKFVTLQVLMSANDGFSETEAVSALEKINAFKSSIPGLVNVLFPTSDTKDASRNYFPMKLNVVGLPFDGIGPNQHGEALGKDPATFFGNCAKELVTLASLWPGQDESFLEGARFVPGSKSNVIIERSFVRYVDASHFVQSVIDKVIDGDGKSLPTSYDDSGIEFNVLSGDEAKSNVVSVGLQFVNAHPDQLKYVSFIRGAGRAPIAMNFFKAIGYYFQWIWNWLRRQPSAILQKVIADKKEAIASATQSMLGGNSKFMVVVGGVSSHSNPNGVTMAADSIMDEVARVRQSSTIQTPPAAPQHLWSHLSEVATSLVDGKPLTGSEIEMPQMPGTGRYIVTDPNLITPNFQQKFFDIPANLNIPYRGQRISASDPLTARLVQDGLEEAVSSGTIPNTSVVAVARLQQELQKWRNSNTSFTWTVGDFIAEGISQALKAWEAMTRRVTEISTADLVAAEAKAQKSLTRLFKGVFSIVGISLLLWAIQAAIVFVASKTWPALAPWWTIPASIVGLLILVWNVIGVLLMYGAVRELFRLENALDADDIRNLEREKKHIIEQITQLTTYYKQYQAWVAVLSSFVHKSSSSESTVASNLIPTQGLPQSLKVARLLPDIAGNDGDFNTRIAKQFYRPGWLSQRMTSVLSAEVGDYNSITLDAMAAPSTPLSKALTWVQTKEASGAIRAQAATQIQALATSGTAYQDWQVEITNAIGAKQLLSGNDLIGQLGKGDDFLPAAALFNAKGQVSDAAAVDRSQSVCAFDERLSLQSDLSRTLVIKKNTSGSRSLDFLGIRFEVTGILSTNSLKIFEKIDSSETNSVSRGSKGEAPTTPA